MSAIYILWLRELKRYSRSRAQIVASLGQPMLYLLALGFGLGPVFQKAGQGSYLQFVAPGVIGMSILFTSIFSGVGLLWDRQFGFLKETLVAPVPRMQIMVGRTLGGATVAMIQGMLVLDRLPDRRLPSASLAALPLALAVHGADRDRLRRARHRDRLDAAGHAGLSADHELPGDADLLPVGRAVSARVLPTALAIVTRLDPLTYGIDGLRGTFIGVSHFGVATDLAVLARSGRRSWRWGRARSREIQI